MERNKITVDIALYVALSEEFGAILKELGDEFRPFEISDIALTCFLGPIRSDSLHKTFQVLVVPAGKMGTTRAASVTSAILSRFQPKDVAVIGIAGSLVDELQPGDVFIPDRVNEYLANSAAVEVVGGKEWTFQTSGNQFVTDHRLLNRFQLLPATQEELHKKWRRKAQERFRRIINKNALTLLKAKGLEMRSQSGLYTGDDRILASGPAVGKGKTFVNWLKKEVDRKAAAIEMESAGVYDAAGLRTPAPRAIAVRGISDFADERKEILETAAKGGFRKLAVKNAITLFIAAVEVGLFAEDSALPLEGEKLEATGSTPVASSQPYKEVALTRTASTNFLTMLKQPNVTLEDYDAKRRNIATYYQTLLDRVHTLRADDPHIAQLRDAAEKAIRDKAIRDKNLVLAEELLNEISAWNISATQELQALTTQRQLSAAQAKAANGTLQMMQLAYAAAAGYFRQATELVEHLPAGSQASLASYLDGWGQALYEGGHYSAAEPRYRRALEIRKKVLGLQDRDTANSLSHLGRLLYARGDRAGAKPYLESALAIRERVLGPLDRDTANSLNNLAVLLNDQGDVDGAEPLYRRALAIREQVLGPEDPETATSLNNLGRLLRARGDLAGARPYYERALAIRKRKLKPPEHPDIARSLNNLGTLLHAQGDLTGAKRHLEKALAVRKQVLGSQHPDTATSLNNLGALLRDQGKLTGAKCCLDEALAIRKQVLGGQHPDTATSLNDLGTLLRAQGDLTGAKSYYEDALQIYRSRLGKDHSLTQTVLVNLKALEAVE